MSTKKIVLIILDGWGIGRNDASNAIYKANTPFINECYKKYPHAQLLTCGEHVGLPEGQMGNSEVGHLNIGAGRVVYQDLVKINVAIRNRSFFSNPVLTEAFKRAKSEGKAVHLMGLVSDGGVHSSQEHLHALCAMASEYGLKDVFVHAFTDGRDTDPNSGLGFIENFLKVSSSTPAKLASVVGRYYAMDRDNRWERVKQAYDLLTAGTGEKSTDILKTIKESYEKGVTDEFIKPVVMVGSNANPVGVIKEDDVVICFNFRTDRCREITIALTQQDMPDYGMHTLKLHYVTMTNYDKTFKNVRVVFDKDNLSKTLGEVLSAHGKKQIRIAETEKYPHVTFFFSGGREKEFEGEKRILIPSPKVATYDLKPEMSANEITGAICKELKMGETDFICLNFANPDMVGHTGVFSAIVSAVETVDACAQKVVEEGMANGYSFVIIADHGNADNAINEDGTPNTAHSLNPVPCILIDDTFKNITNGKLADIAPTILKMMKLPQPAEMDGQPLV